MPVDKLTKPECCGCNACGDICPTQAITFPVDNEGFWYPEINYDKCIQCELCTKICPEINIQSLKHNDYPKPSNSIAAINNNMEERWHSTSGGAFSAFADFIYNQNGYVGGALYTEDFSVVNFISNNHSDLEKLRSSKYLQSNAEELYAKVKRCLSTDKKVLVCGTPCQMAGLRSFLGKDYENLIIIDFICRGVNSPKVYKKYLESLERKYGCKVESIKAKNKELGWRNLTRKITFKNGEKYYGVLMEDDFRRGYHTNVYCRPSCYYCKFKGFPRISDITIGDFWGIEKYAPSLDNNIGTSVILINSKKGDFFWKDVKSKFTYKKLPLEAVYPGNTALFNSIEVPTIDRERFFNDLTQLSFEEVVSLYFPRQVQHEEKSSISHIRIMLSLLKKLYKKWGFNPSKILQFYKANNRKNTKTNLQRGCFIFPEPGITLDINTSAKINLNVPFYLGLSIVKNFSMPGCLRMERDSILNILGGPLDRYGNCNAPYAIKTGCYIEILNGGELTFHSGASNVGLTIMCAHKITIGNGVRIGRNVSIRDWNGPHVIISDRYSNGAEVTIGDNVWLCSGCSILPGVNIGPGCVIGANAVVTRDVPANCLVVGSPARVVKENIEWY